MSIGLLPQKTGTQVFKILPLHQVYSTIISDSEQIQFPNYLYLRKFEVSDSGYYISLQSLSCVPFGGGGGHGGGVDVVGAGIQGEEGPLAVAAVFLDLDAFLAAFERGAERVVLVGTDAPDRPVEFLSEALAGAQSRIAQATNDRAILQRAHKYAAKREAAIAEKAAIDERARQFAIAQGHAGRGRRPPWQQGFKSCS